MLSRLPALVAMAMAGALGPMSPTLAQSGPECERESQYFGRCTIQIPGPPSHPDVKPISDPGSSGGGGASCVSSAREVPCSDPLFGAWSNANQCYIRLADPQPPPSSPFWEGRYPEGAIYDCVDPSSGPYSNGARFWLPDGADVGMTPEQAAEAVVRRMDLRAADIGIVPEDRPGSIGAVGAPVYMWTARGPATFGPQTLTASADGITISATARVDRIVWSMGDGATVTCRTPGTPYEDRYGFNPSPDCGHRYTRTSAGQPGNAYPITATSFWVVDWTGPGGSAGQVTLDLTSRTSIQVGELQALVTR
jgi:hypothetical protein